MSIDTIELWHKRARNKPTRQDFNVQLGCHLEEIVEMLDTLVLHDETEQWLRAPMAGRDMSVRTKLDYLANELKSGRVKAEVDNRKELLDALADQVVTSVGVGYCAGMEMEEAVKRVNRSNWSKFGDNGQPIRDENGKIAKGPKYAPPDLDGCY